MFFKNGPSGSPTKRKDTTSGASNRARETAVRRKEQQSNEKFRPKASEGVFTHSSAAQAGTRRCFFKRPEQKSDGKEGHSERSEQPR